MCYRDVYFKWITKAIIILFFCNICLLQTYLAYAYMFPSRYSSPFIEKKKKNYSLSLNGVVIDETLQVLLPERAIFSTDTDLFIPGIGFNLTVKRAYKKTKHNKGIFGRGWKLIINEKLIFESDDKIIVKNVISDTVFYLKKEKVYISPNNNKIKKLSGGNYHKESKHGNITVFSKSGRMLSKIDNNGNKLNFEYQDNKLREICNPSSGRSLHFIYSQDGQVKKITDGLKRTISYHYNSNNQLVQVNFADSQNITYSYDKKHRLIGKTDENGIEARITYVNDEDNRVKKVKKGKEQWVSFDTIASKKSIKVEDHFNKKYFYKYKYNKKFVKLIITNNNGWEKTYKFSSSGRLLSFTKPNGFTQFFKYDHRGRLAQYKNTKDFHFTFKYVDSSGFPIEIIDKRGPRLSFKYDKKGNFISANHSGLDPVEYDWYQNGVLKQIKSGEDIIIQNKIDEVGNIIQQNVGTNIPEKYFYDKVGRMLRRVKKDGTIIEYGYNEFDQVVSITRNGKRIYDISYGLSTNTFEIKDALGRELTYECNDRGDISRAVLSDGSEFTVDRVETKQGRQESYVFPNKAMKSFEYNHFDQLVKKTDAFGKETSFEWSPEGLLKRKEDSNGNYVKYFYDSSGRLVEKRYSDDREVKFRYENGLLISIKAPYFHQSYEYNKNMNALKRVIDNNLDITLDYLYDKKGKVKTIKIKGVGQINYRYNENNRLTQISDHKSQITKYSYDDLGRISHILYPNGVVQKFTYYKGINNPGLIKIALKDRILFIEKYTYSTDGFFREVQDRLSNTVKKYAYNKVEAIAKFQRHVHDGESQSIVYSYDQNYNLKNEIYDNARIEYDYKGIGQLRHKGDQRFEYDRNGNLILSRSETGQVRYEYDCANRLKTAHFPDGSRKDFRYDPQGRLVLVKQGKDERHILWNGKHRLLELDQNKELVKLYTYGETLDSLVSVTTDETYYMHQDPLGSVRLVTNDLGQPVADYEYLPFGEPIHINQAKQQANDFMYFAGRPYDPDLNAYYLRARFYDPKLKRFLTRDAFEGSIVAPTTMNPYMYALNNPVNAKDPEGEIVFSLMATAAATMGAAIFITGVAASKLTGPPKVTAYSPGAEYSEDPGKELREMPERMDEIGEAVKVLHKGTKLGGRGASPTIDATNIEALSDPDPQKAEAARGEEIGGLLDDAVDNVSKEGIKKGAGEVIGQGPIRNEIVSRVTDWGWKKGEEYWDSPSKPASPPKKPEVKEAEAAGSSLITVPDAVGLKAKEAKSRIASSGLSVALSIGDPASAASEEYTVQSQSPESGSTAEPDSAVSLVIAGKYEEKGVVVPNVIGLSAKESKSLLVSSGLSATLSIGDPASAASEEYTVQSQSPEPGSTAEPDSAVSLVIAGKYEEKEAVVPNVIGLNRLEAKLQMADAGLVVATNQGDDAPEASLSNTVQSQSLAPGAAVSEQSTITLTVYGPYEKSDRRMTKPVKVIVLASSQSAKLGETVLFRAIAVFPGGAKKDVTREASWSPGPANVYQVPEKIPEEDHNGKKQITATYHGVSGTETITLKKPSADWGRIFNEANKKADEIGSEDKVILSPPGK